MQKKNDKKNKTKTRSRPKHDYDLIEAAYITRENVKIKDFCKEFNISQQALYKVRKERKWDEKKQAFKSAIANEVIEKAKEEKVVDMLNIRRRLDTAIEEASRILMDAVENPDQFYLQYTSPKERLEAGARFQVKTMVADTKRIELYTRALNTVNTMVNQRLAMDEEFNNDDDKIQVNFIEGNEDYLE